MKTGYTYIENGIPVISAERKPEPPKGMLWDSCGDLPPTQEQENDYKTSLKKWERTLIPAVNAHVSQHPIEGHDEITILKPVFEIVTPGQKVQHDGNEITKIL